MSSAADDGLPLGYLLKRAHLGFEASSDEALAELGLNGRELGILRVVARNPGSSQLQLAERIGVDRTTMVTMLDSLERKGIIARRADPDDRRRNVVELTSAGKQTYARAVTIGRDVESRYLSTLDAEAATALRDALNALFQGSDRGSRHRGS